MDRLPNRLNVASMGRIGLKISTGTVHNILYRIGTDLDPPSRQILKRILEAYVLHVDETSISLNGRLAWIWIFLNPETDDAYYVIRRSRGGDVLREALGKGRRRGGGGSCATGWRHTENTRYSGAGLTS